jgi:hypothetical protein
MAHTQHTHSLAHLEEALSVLFCLIDDAYALLNPHGARRYEAMKRLSDSEVITLALFQQSCGVWKANALSCATPRGSLLTCSLGWWVSILPRSIGE